MNPTDFPELSFAGRAIHGGLAPDPVTGAILTPIYQTTTYRQKTVGGDPAYAYSRVSNPTVAALERNLGALEQAEPAVATGSGLSALTTLFMATLKAGDRVVCGETIYGGTVRLLREYFAHLGVRADFADSSSAEELALALREPARLLIVESPGNPTLRLTDISLCARLAKRAGALLVVDNTFLTPALMDAFGLGADVVVHSTTKYLEGHNATIGGAILTRDPELRERLAYTRKAIGTIQSPLEAWLTLRGIKTLPLRMERHSASALTIARWLEARPEVARVSYPWLDNHPQRELARKQQRAGGGVVSFELQGGAPTARAFLERVQLCALAENLGAAETLITHPATMTHAAVPAAQRARAGITDGLIRLSVGLEDASDIIRDLEQALVSVRAEVRA
jgi:cystathionine beta-lyase/cystathionine gamma-synthase